MCGGWCEKRSFFASSCLVSFVVVCLCVCLSGNMCVRGCRSACVLHATTILRAVGTAARACSVTKPLLPLLLVCLSVLAVWCVVCVGVSPVCVDEMCACVGVGLKNDLFLLLLGLVSFVVVCLCHPVCLEICVCVCVGLPVCCMLPRFFALGDGGARLQT